MSDTVKIEEAKNADLLHYAGTVLGLDVKRGQSNTHLIGLIQSAKPGLDEIPLPPKGPEPMDLDSAAAAEIPAPPSPELVTRGSRSGALQHYSKDPKVRLRVEQTTDKTRAKDVTVAPNGDVFRWQRGVDVSVPYRVYLALRDAKEMEAVETGEINPISGLPKKVWQEVQSYPFTILQMPSEEEIAAFHKATDNAAPPAHVRKAA